MRNDLFVIQANVQRRSEEILSSHQDWPCRKGCADCCRSLASVPLVTSEEWQLIQTEIDKMPRATAELVRQQIRDAESASRPVVCPLLDTDAGICLVYEARPVACRAYGFYAEREKVLGCGRIEAMERQGSEVVWGNHLALEDRIRTLGPVRELHQWMNI